MISTQKLSNLQEYEAQYNKNYDLVKNKYKRRVSSTLSLEKIVDCVVSINNNSVLNEKKNVLFEKKLYCFLCSLAFVEVDTGKTHDKFIEDDWKVMASLSKVLTQEEILSFKCNAFKNNWINYPWSTQEDDFLRTIILKKKENGHKVSWLSVAKELNSTSEAKQLRRPAHCLERWKNTLQYQYQKGQWTQAEDIEIIKFVLINGTKWSKLAKLSNNKRTEHNLKNRFFSILGKFLKMPTKKVKKFVNYRDTALLLNLEKALR